MLLLPGRVVLAQVRICDSMSGGTSTPLGEDPLTYSRKARGALCTCLGRGGEGEGLWLVQCSRYVQGFRSCDSRVIGIEPRGRQTVEHQPLHKAEAKTVTCNAGYTDVCACVRACVCVCVCVCPCILQHTSKHTLNAHYPQHTHCHTHCTYVCIPHQHSIIMPSHHTLTAQTKQSLYGVTVSSAIL